MAELNQDLIVEILLCLPVISLFRFRSLSKSMCAFIDGSYFVNSHLSKSSQNFNLRKIIFKSTRKFHVCDLNLEEKILILDKPFSFSQKEVFGYCKGLILLSRSKFGLSLWNPSTRQCMDLPDYPFDLGSYTVIASGLGYDDSIHDYKVFIMIRDLKQNLESEIRVWIYQLKSNIWIRVQNFPYLQYQTINVPGYPDIGYFSTDGSLNWLYSLLSNEWQKDIVSFDMRKETFSIIPQPVYSINEQVLTDLHVLEGFLVTSYFFYPCSKVGRVPQAELYIWKKDGAGDVFNWTKLFSVTSVEPLPLSFDIYMFEGFFVLGYSKGGDKVLLKFVDFDYFALYDLKEKSLAKVEIDKDPDWFFSTVCVESLVPVTGGA